MYALIRTNHPCHDKNRLTFAIVGKGDNGILQESKMRPNNGVASGVTGKKTTWADVVKGEYNDDQEISFY